MQKSMAECKQFPLVLASMMELMVRKLMSDDGSKPSQLICLTEVGELKMFSRNSLVFATVGQSVATAMNKNYPARLHRMYLLDLPPSLLWIFNTIVRFVDPETQRKITPCPSSSAEVPRTYEPILPLPRPAEPARAAPAQTPRRSIWNARGLIRQRATPAAPTPSKPARLDVAAPAEGLSAAIQPWAGGDTPGHANATKADTRCKAYQLSSILLHVSCCAMLAFMYLYVCCNSSFKKFNSLRCRAVHLRYRPL